MTKNSERAIDAKLTRRAFVGAAAATAAVGLAGCAPKTGTEKEMPATGASASDISWDEESMGIALLSAMRSKDNNSQVGACIVSPENKILSLGYNGMPIGCNDDDMPWEREGDDLETKYMYVCHSELNAILNSPNHDLRGSRMYVTLFPCNECAKAIIQSGIKELIYLSDKYHDTHACVASRRMFKMTGVVCRAYQPTGREIKLDV